MTGFAKKFLLFLLIALPSTLMLTENGGGLFVRAEEDAVEGEEDAAVEEEDGDATVETDEGTLEATGEGDKEEEDEEPPIVASPDAKTTILFTQPRGNEFPAGHMVKFLVGFTNAGSQDFVIDTMEASFRYPQDFTYYIQNFTAVRYDRLVDPSREATFEYAFTPSETFHARPFGLVINLNYHDAEGTVFQDAVFNETISIVEPDEGLDGETFFLYVFLVAVGVLLLVGVQQLLGSFSKKRLAKPRQPIEMGTQNKGDVDYDWLPKETLNEMNKSPRRSPRQSPGRRRAKRSSGASED